MTFVSSPPENIELPCGKNASQVYYLDKVISDICLLHVKHTPVIMYNGFSRASQVGSAHIKVSQLAQPWFSTTTGLFIPGLTASRGLSLTCLNTWLQLAMEQPDKHSDCSG